MASLEILHTARPGRRPLWGTPDRGDQLCQRGKDGRHGVEQQRQFVNKVHQFLLSPRGIARWWRPRDGRDQPLGHRPLTPHMRDRAARRKLIALPIGPVCHHRTPSVQSGLGKEEPISEFVKD